MGTFSCRCHLPFWMRAVHFWVQSCLWNSGAMPVLLEFLMHLEFCSCHYSYSLPFCHTTGFLCSCPLRLPPRTSAIFTCHSPGFQITAASAVSWECLQVGGCILDATIPFSRYHLFRSPGDSFDLGLPFDSFCRYTVTTPFCRLHSGTHFHTASPHGYHLMEVGGAWREYIHTLFDAIPPGRATWCLTTMHSAWEWDTSFLGSE